MRTGQKTDRAPYRAQILAGNLFPALRKNGMPSDVCPEQWCVENPGKLVTAYTDCIEAGAKIIMTATAEAGEDALAHYNLSQESENINRALAAIAARAKKPGVLLGGCIAPLQTWVHGHSQDELFEQYKRQAVALVEGGVDFLFLANQRDLSEMRTAILALRSLGEAPIWVSMALPDQEEKAVGKAQSVAIVAEALCVETVGISGAGGMPTFRAALEAMHESSRLALLAYPDAGTVMMIDGEAIRSIDEEENAHDMMALAELGAHYVGICQGDCLTNIARTSETLHSIAFLPFPSSHDEILICSRTKKLAIERAMMIGNIRASAHPSFLQAMREGRYEAVFDAIDHMGEAQVLSINAVAEGLDEQAALYGMAQAAWTHSALPLAFRPASPDAIERVLRDYPGRALVILDCVSALDRSAVQRISEYYGAVCMY